MHGKKELTRQEQGFAHQNVSFSENNAVTVYDLLVSGYGNEPHFKVFCKKFPKMLEFSKEINVMPWEEEEKCGETVIKMEIDGKIIYWESIGAAYPESKKVAFREDHLDLPLILHELGHVFYDVDDDVWSKDFSFERKGFFFGGEALLWLIIEDKISGKPGKNEELVKAYMDFLRDVERNPVKATMIFNQASKNVGKEYGIFIENVMDFLQWTCGKWIYLWEENGFSREKVCSNDLDSECCFEFIRQVLAYSNYKRPRWTCYLEKLLDVVDEEYGEVKNKIKATKKQGR